MKKIILKFLVLGIILIGLNYIYIYTFFESDLQKHSDLINKVRNVIEKKAEIVYVGESSDISFKSTDIEKKTISQFIGEHFPTIKLESIIKEASHSGIFYSLLSKIPTNSSVKTVIVTMNLRSFDASWRYSNLETPLQKSTVLLKNTPPIFNRFLLSFKGYDIKSDLERENQFKESWSKEKLKFPSPFKHDNVMDWDKSIANTGIKDANGNLDFPATELACHFVKTYAFQIDTLSNPRIKDFDNIVKLAKERNWNLVFNLLAENTEKAEELVGKELIYLMKQNRDLLIKRYNKNGVKVVDNLDLVPSSEYIDKNWTTEHYAEKGRKIIAKNVAASIKEIYPKAYVDVQTTNIKPIDFFNDCEGELIWGQMQTLTNENKFSGNKSSKIGQNQNFSVTFEYPISNLPDSLKKVNVEFYVFQTSLNNEIKLTVENSGVNLNTLWSGVPIPQLTDKINAWTKVQYEYQLPENFYAFELTKIYLYNPTNGIINIDDIKIKFSK